MDSVKVDTVAVVPEDEICIFDGVRDRCDARDGGSGGEGDGPLREVVAR